MDKEKLKFVLENQTQLLLSSIVSVEFLIQYPEYLKKIGEEEPKYLSFLYKLIRDNIIISITQLFHEKEHYSFNALRKLILENYSKNDEIFKGFNLTLKSGHKLFRDLNILDIRNQHVGHLLSSRQKQTVDWNKISDLIKVGCKTHDYVNLKIFKQHNFWDLDQKLLHQVYGNDLRSREIYSAWRKMYKNDINEMNREKIGEIAKTYWP
jgi:hypothetical protein